LGFEARMKPIHSELKTLVQGYLTKESHRMADRAWDDYFGPTKKPATLPKSLLHQMLRNQNLRGVIDHMSLMDDELKLIDNQRPVWRDTVGEMLKRDVIEKDRRIVKVRAGKFMLAEMARNANMLQDLLTQSEIVSINVVESKQGTSCGKSGEMVCDSPEGL